MQYENFKLKSSTDLNFRFCFRQEFNFKSLYTFNSTSYCYIIVHQKIFSLLFQITSAEYYHIYLVFHHFAEKTINLIHMTEKSPTKFYVFETCIRRHSTAQNKTSWTVKDMWKLKQDKTGDFSAKATYEKIEIWMWQPTSQRGREVRRREAFFHFNNVLVCARDLRQKYRISQIFFLAKMFSSILKDMRWRKKDSMLNHQAKREENKSKTSQSLR